MTSFSKYGRDVLETSHKRHFYKRYIWDVIKTLKIFEIYLRGLWDVSLKKEVFDTHLSKNKPSTTHPREYMGYIWEYINIWEKVFMNGPSKIFWRLSSTNFTWSILEYFVPNICGNKTVRMDLYWKPCQALNLELFPKQMTALSKLTIFVKGFIIDDWQGLKCSSHLHDPLFCKTNWRYC